MDTNAKARYDQLLPKRNSVEDRAEKYAEWTIPSLFPDSNSTDQDAVTNLLNSIGAEAVNTLGNKLLLALFNPSQPFFRADLSNKAKADLMNELGIREETEVDVLMAGVEREAIKHLVEKGLREQAFPLLQQLIVTGNCMLELRKDKPMNVYTLRDYVVRRNGYSEPEEFILKQDVIFGSLTTEQKMKLADEYHKDSDIVSFFFWGNVNPESGKWEVHQYLDKVLLTDDNSKGVYTKDNVPFVPLTWRLARGHNYGTGLVEEYAGDFSALEILSDSFTKGLAIAADIKQLVNPAGLTDIDELVNSKIGDYVLGRADDISTPQLNKNADFQIMLQGAQEHTQRIARAFLMNSSLTRNAERVTAYEIQQQINELEQSLGGVYTRLATTLQRPLAVIALQAVDSNFSKANGVTPNIVTGLEAISRFTEVSQLQMWLQDLVGLGSMPQEVIQRLKIEAISKFMGASRGIDTEKFVKSEDEFNREQEAMMQRQQQMMAQEQMTGAVAQQVGGS